jgi:phage shock protein PspC (stress-responsive transcriptional regulator)
MSEEKRLFRSQTDRVLGGVSGGLGAYFNVDPVLIRIGFVILGLVNGIGAVIYLIMWLLVPDQANQGMAGGDVVSANVEDIKNRARGLGESVTGSKTQSGLIGLILVVLGALFLLRNLTGLDFWALFPALLILAGIYLLFTRR